MELRMLRLWLATVTVLQQMTLWGALGVPPELELEEDEHTNCAKTLRLMPSFPFGNRICQDEIDVPGPSASPRTCFQSENSTSATQGDGLQDIGEEGEEEDSDGTPQDGSKTVEPEAQIHGLSISTDPVPSSPTRISEAELPTLPLRCRSRTDSRGSVSNYMRPTSRSSARRDVAYHSSTSDFGDCDSERAYDPLAIVCQATLSSRATSLVSHWDQPYVPTIHRCDPRILPRPVLASPLAPGGRPPSWIDGWDSVKYEYAATVASGSSIGVGDGE
ncbi:hypothetical protein EDD16DRAFT_1801481 [Pisolithus croceorrhizus]|nr:hypothetical protein EDD16DRAFT_1801481 [Pisolithus croceorrhizus]